MHAQATHVLCLLFCLQGVVAPHMAGSGLLQALLEGALLLLAADPAAYPSAAEEQQQLWDALKFTHQASLFLLDTGIW